MPSCSYLHPHDHTQPEVIHYDPTQDPARKSTRTKHPTRRLIEDPNWNRLCSDVVRNRRLLTTYITCVCTLPTNLW